MRENNWLLFTKNEDGKSYFKELIVQNSKLYYTTGAFKTWGETEVIELNNSSIEGEMERILSDIEREGYTLERNWNFNNKEYDYGLLVEELVISLDNSIKQALIQEPDINAFGIGTDDGAMTIFPLFSKFNYIENVADEELFLINEWEFWDFDFDTFQIPYRLILKFHSDSKEEYNEQFQGFYNKLIEVSIEAMNRVKVQLGLNVNNSIFIVSSTESMLPVEQFKLLNSENLSERYSQFMKD